MNHWWLAGMNPQNIVTFGIIGVCFDPLNRGFCLFAHQVIVVYHWVDGAKCCVCSVGAIS